MESDQVKKCYTGFINKEEIKTGKDILGINKKEIEMFKAMFNFKHLEKNEKIKENKIEEIKKDKKILLELLKNSLYNNKNNFNKLSEENKAIIENILIKNSSNEEEENKNKINIDINTNINTSNVIHLVDNKAITFKNSFMAVDDDLDDFKNNISKCYKENEIININLNEKFEKEKDFSHIEHMEYINTNQNLTEILNQSVVLNKDLDKLLQKQLKEIYERKYLPNIEFKQFNQNVYLYGTMKILLKVGENGQIKGNNKYL
jgi:hypothetical protein